MLYREIIAVCSQIHTALTCKLIKTESGGTRDRSWRQLLRWRFTIKYFSCHSERKDRIHMSDTSVLCCCFTELPTDVSPPLQSRSHNHKHTSSGIKFQTFAGNVSCNLSPSAVRYATTQITSLIPVPHAEPFLKINRASPKTTKMLIPYKPGRVLINHYLMLVGVNTCVLEWTRVCWVASGDQI
jgi:hypothetical protein